jgi:hypothetical protein
VTGRPSAWEEVFVEQGVISPMGFFLYIHDLTIHLAGGRLTNRDETSAISVS